MSRTITVYQYSELSDTAKTRAREWFRSVKQKDPSIDWADPTIEDFKTCMGFVGWDVTNVWWSGFGSQGDGAQFDGKWNAARVNAEALKQHAPSDKHLHEFADTFATIAGMHPSATATVESTGRYQHEYANTFNVWDTQGNDAPEDLVQALTDVTRRAMHWLYVALERESESKNSDESVTEELESRDDEFTASGVHVESGT